MVYKHCFVTNCPLSSEESNVVSMFCVPKGKFKEWQEIMKHKPGLTNHSLFCSRPFNLKDSKMTRNYRKIFYRIQWRLKKNVQPSLHLGYY